MFIITDDCCFLCDDDGQPKNLPYNFSAFGQNFFGPVIWIGTSGEDFCDLPITFQAAKILFPEMFNREVK